MMVRLINVISIAMLTLSGCCDNEAMFDVAEEAERVRSSDRALLQAETERDLEGAMVHIAEGAVFQPPNSPPIVGSEAIRAFYTEWFNMPFRGIYRDSDTVLVSSSGDLAYLVGTSHIQLDMPDGMVRLPGKYLTIWRRIDERWLCVAVSWSGNQPAG